MESQEKEPLIYVQDEDGEITYVRHHERRIWRILLLAGSGLGILVGLGIALLSILESDVVPLSKEKSPGTVKLKFCCLRDVHGAQHGLTKLSSEAQKLQIRLKTAGGPQAQKSISAIFVLEEQSKSLWDQLEALTRDPPYNTRRQLRDISITLDVLKEHFLAAERCCGLSPDVFPALRGPLQVVEFNLQNLENKIKDSP